MVRADNSSFHACCLGQMLLLPKTPVVKLFSTNGYIQCESIDSKNHKHSENSGQKVGRSIIRSFEDNNNAIPCFAKNKQNIHYINETARKHAC